MTTPITVGYVYSKRGQIKVEAPGIRPERLSRDDELRQDETIVLYHNSRCAISMADGSRLTMAGRQYYKLADYPLSEENRGKTFLVVCGRLKEITPIDSGYTHRHLA